MVDSPQSAAHPEQVSVGRWAVVGKGQVGKPEDTRSGIPFAGKLGAGCVLDLLETGCECRGIGVVEKIIDQAKWIPGREAGDVVDNRIEVGRGVRDIDRTRKFFGWRAVLKL